MKLNFFHKKIKLLDGGSPQEGITLILVIVILSALLSISVGIFNVVVGEILISGEIADSFIAFYAADRAIDKLLYLDRSNPELNDNDKEDTTATVSPTGCYVVQIFKTPAIISSQCGISDVNVCIRSTGQFRCGTNASRAVKRGFMVTY